MDHPASFQSLGAWRLARQLVRNLYQLTASFPSDEKFILVSQIRRAAHSVPANIAEGRGRLSNGEWQHFLGQSRGSLLELESHVTIATDLGFCTEDASAVTMELIRTTAKAVNGLLRSSRQTITKKYKAVTDPSGYPIPDTRYLIPDTRYLIPDTQLKQPRVTEFQEHCPVCLRQIDGVACVVVRVTEKEHGLGVDAI